MSCGPRTSRLMVQVLTGAAHRGRGSLCGVRFAAREADPPGHPDIQSHHGRLAIGRAWRQAASGGRARDGAEAAHRREPARVAVFLSDSVIVATGGPGELHRDSVYPAPRQRIGS
jgi:succinate dehydrogenase / fumarate reductase, flavoprotein subunit